MDVMNSILSLFNVMTVEDDARLDTPDVSNIAYGFITDFRLTSAQTDVLRTAFKPLDIRTLFTVQERKNGDVFALIAKQVLHYIEVYGLGMDGSIVVPMANDQAVTLKYVRGVSREQLGTLVRDLIYSSRPVKDTVALKEILDAREIEYDINSVRNNELRVLLFDETTDSFENGDDAVRWMCFKATGSPLLIKSREVIESIQAGQNYAEFFRRHEMSLAQVFNRHKQIILAAKRAETSTIINRISRRSKKVHIPIHESIAKKAVTLALNDNDFDINAALRRVTLRDKMKYLNLLAYKKTQQTQDAFVIRNGKLHIQGDRKVYTLSRIAHIEQTVLWSIRMDLSSLTGKSILLDDAVDYGLPISRKQTLGNLPYGTTVTVDAPSISVGIHWEDRGGARDLDLSTVNQDGHRVGWGEASGYSDDQVLFSGDVVNAPNGAMEFMTSTTARYGLFVNIFTGKVGAKMHLVIGGSHQNSWIRDPIVREEHVLDSKGCSLGFVNEKTFVVYCGRLGEGHASFNVDKPRALAARGTFEFWTVRRLLNAVDLAGTIDTQVEKVYDHDLTYERFSYDRLEALFFG